MTLEPQPISHGDNHVLAQELGELLLYNSLTISTAESCTGGLVAGAITDVAGSSAWFERSVVTYSNAAKHDLLGVPQTVFDEQGAVSEACVLAMAHGALSAAGADLAVSVSGIAGPGGATAGKPVGTVWIGWAFVATVPVDEPARGLAGDLLEAQRFQFSGERSAIRQQAVYETLRGTIFRLNRAGSRKQ